MSRNKKKSFKESVQIQNGELMEKHLSMVTLKEPEIDFSMGCNPHCTFFNARCFMCDVDGHAITDWKLPCPREKAELGVY